MPITPTFTPDYSAFLALPTAELLDVLADQVELQLTGGQPTSDSPYDWRALRLLVQEVFDAETLDTETRNQAVLQADYLARKKDELDSYYIDLKAKSDFWENPDRWVQSFPVPLLYDDDRKEQYFILPQAFVTLRRYQNLPSENTVRDIQARNRALRQKYRFAYMPGVTPAALRLPGGLLGRWGYYTEQTTATEDGEQYRCYLIPSKPSCKFPDNVPLLAYFVIRDSRTSGLPDPPLELVKHFNIVRKVVDAALLRTRQDKTIDANPQPTQIQQ